MPGIPKLPKPSGPTCPHGFKLPVNCKGCSPGTQPRRPDTKTRKR